MTSQPGPDRKRREFPEEAHESGHDAELSPAAGGKDVGVRRATAPVHAGSTEPLVAGHASQAAVDAAFLVKGFGIPPGAASRLVTRPAHSANATEREARRLLAEDDPLRDVPTPKEPATDLTSDTDEERLKPVHRPSRNH